MKKLSVIFLLVMVVTFGLCIVTENFTGNNLTAKTITDHGLFAFSNNHSVICDISSILQKTFQGISAQRMLIFLGLILSLAGLFRKKIKGNLSPPILTSILIGRREYYRKLSWSASPIQKTFQKLNPRLYA